MFLILSKLWSKIQFFSFFSLLVLYLFFLVVTFPFYLISLIITPYGSSIILGALVWRGIVGLTRSISFPGHTKAVLRDMEKQYARNISERLIQLSDEAIRFCDVVQKIKEQQLKNWNGKEFLAAFNNLHFRRFQHLEPVVGGLKFVISGNFGHLITEQALKQSTSLYEKLLDVCNSLDNLFPSLHSCLSEKQVEGARLLKILESVQVCDSMRDLQISCPALRTLAVELKPPQKKEGNPLISAIQNYRDSRRLFDHLGNIQLMRQEVIHTWQAKRVSIPVSRNCDLDGIYIFASGTWDGPISEKGTLIFFNPNAGLYESICCKTLVGADWLPFYQHLGYDIFVCNYRGYGNSGGFPHPDALNKDGKAVVDFLKSDAIRAKRIIVHGESMGGMVACSVGKNCAGDVAAIIADRTFSQLDAAAERLLAPWAGKAMRFFTGWKNDSVANFLQASCPKLICQDHADQIIADTASLQTGVAVQLELGVSFYGVSDQGYEYTIAEALSQPPPCINIIPPRQGGKFLESQMIHLYGCLKYISNLAGFQCEQTSSPLTEDNPLNNANTSTIEMIQMEEIQTDLKSVDEITQDGWTLVNDQEKVAGERSSSFSKVAWICLREIKGINGKKLSQSISCYDQFRAWVCNFVVWGPHLIASKLAYPPMDILNLRTALSDLNSSLKQRNDEVGQYLMYVISCFKVIESRLMGGPPSSLLPEDLGELLQLHCGHNARFHESEKERLIHFLKKHGLLDPVGNTPTAHTV